MSTIEQQLMKFAGANSVEEFIEFGSPFLKTSAASKAAKSSEFASGLAKLLALHGRSNGSDGLKALAFAWRLTSVSAMRRHRLKVIDYLGNGTDQPTELPTALDDPDDRRNLYEAFQHQADKWLPGYLVQAITNDRDGSLVRRTAAETLVLKQGSLVETLEGMTNSFKALRLDQKDPDVGRARVLIGNLSALSNAIWSLPDELRIGADFGAVFRRLVSLAASLNVDDKGLRIEISRAVINFFMTVARLNPELASAADNYAFVRALKVLFRPASWPEELTSDLRKVANLAAQRLIFLLVLGRPNNQLRSLIIELLGDTSGPKLLKKLASLEASLSDDQLFWLAKGRAREGSAAEESAEASMLAKFDRDLAEVMRLADIVAATSGRAGREFSNEAALLPESTASAVGRFISRSAESAKLSLDLAEKRGLTLEGRVGEVVEFDPSLHLPTDGAVGEETVRLLTRAVVRSLSEGRRIVVLKAEVGQV